MHEFAEEYVANLSPRDERYETRLGDDFYVSTFPNGVKTWIYLYEVNGFVRRQTLGVYPEMPIETALDTLYAARRTRSVEQELMDQGLNGSSVVREDSPIDLNTKRTNRSFRPNSFVLGATGGAVLAALLTSAVWWAVGAGTKADTIRVAATPSTQLAKSMPAIAPVPLTDDARPQATVAQKQTQAAGQTETSEPHSPAKASLALGDSQRAVRELQRDLTGTLAWAQLTSGIARGEPVDNLGWQVHLDENPRQIFFFVRVRGMAGQKVTYRWSHNGVAVQQDTVRVGAGWHSPAYSSVSLGQQHAGAWGVEVIGPDGQSLGAEQFEARTNHGQVMGKR